MCGLALDIKRCFKALPRLPVFHALDRMNFPSWLLQAWAQFVCKQERRFKVRASIGNGHASNVGFPEGCAFSVFAMCIVNWMFDIWLYRAMPNIDLYTYVDDWQVIFGHSGQVVAVWNHVCGFATAMDLELDSDKSYLWAATMADRAVLKSHSHVAVVLSAKDLGAHHNFCKRRGNHHMTARIQALQQHWPKLASSPSPYKQKVQTLYQIAWPRAFVGISITALGPQHYATLRTGALKGLKASRVGANPVLHLSTNGVGADPEMWAILQAFREVRDLANPDAVWQVLTLLVSDPMSVPQNGPAALVLERCRRLGWTVLPNGLVQDELGCFCIFGIHWDELVARVVATWPRVLASEVAHRGSFQGVQFADIPEVLPALRRFGAADQVYLRCCHDGTLYTDTTKNADNRGSESKCVFCGAPDSFYHRIWQCEHFSDCREAFPYPSLVPVLPSCLSCHGWPIKSAAHVLFQQYLCKIHLAFRDIKLPPGLQHGMIHLFTDGSCACPAEAKFRFASWALTLACSRTSMLSNVVVDGGHVPGLQQTAYRGKLLAMLAAVRFAAQHQAPVTVWCDNLAVVRRVRRVLRGLRVKKNSPHADFWLQIEHLVQQYDVACRFSVVKVVSHCADSNATPIEQWAFWHNRLADEAATSINYRRSQDFWNVWSNAAQSVNFLRQLHHQILKVLLQVARKGAVVFAQKTFGAAPPAPQGDDMGAGSLDGCERMQQPAVWTIFPSVVKQYKQENVEMLHRWWSCIGVEAVRSNRPLRWISGLQLYADFYAFTGFQGMVCRGHTCWLVDLADAPANLSVVQRSTMFLGVWKGYIKSNKFRVPIQLARPFSGAISYWTQCYRLPWCGNRLNDIDSLLLKIHRRQLVSPKDLQEVPFFDRLNSGWLSRVFSGRQCTSLVPPAMCCPTNWWQIGFKYFLFSPRKLGKWSNLTNTFQMGWNHQLDQDDTPWKFQQFAPVNLPFPMGK